MGARRIQGNRRREEPTLPLALDEAEHEAVAVADAELARAEAGGRLSDHVGVALDQLVVERLGVVDFDAQVDAVGDRPEGFVAESPDVLGR